MSTYTIATSTAKKPTIWDGTRQVKGYSIPDTDRQFVVYFDEELERWNITHRASGGKICDTKSRAIAFAAGAAIWSALPFDLRDIIRNNDKLHLDRDACGRFGRLTSSLRRLATWAPTTKRFASAGL